MYNCLTLIGRLGSDPIMRATQGGRSICQFSVATDESWLKDGNWEKATTWHKVVCFDRLAERMETSLKKGYQVIIQGKMEYGKYQHKEGHTVNTAEVKATMIKVLDRALDKPNPQAKEELDDMGWPIGDIPF